MSRRLLSLVAAACALLALTSPAAHATRTSGPTAIVSLGDSFISGEAGRWRGNSTVVATDRAGTDRAWTGSGYDASRVYGPPTPMAATAPTSPRSRARRCR